MCRGAGAFTLRKVYVLLIEVAAIYHRVYASCTRGTFHQLPRMMLLMCDICIHFILYNMVYM